MRVFLIGARAAGKTSAGRAAAKALGLGFVDADRHLRATLGRNVAEIVAEEGWPGFRRREAENLRAIARADNRVISTGGGVVLDPTNREFMRSCGLVLYLRAPAEVLAERLAVEPKDGQRPSLTGKSIGEEMAEILEQRHPLYLQTAHQCLDAAADFKQVVDRIVAAVQAAGCVEGA